MSRVSFNRSWTVRPKVSSFSDLMGGLEDAEQVTLPHDAMIGLPRSARDSEGPSTAFFPGGEVEYTKRFDVPDEWRKQRVSVEFQGVYRDAMIFVNGELAGQCPNGYTVFRVPSSPPPLRRAERHPSGGPSTPGLPVVLRPRHPTATPSCVVAPLAHLELTASG